MKKILPTAILAVSCLSGNVLAAETENVRGIYIAPKFIYARQKIDDPSVRINGSHGSSNTRRDSAQGIGLALGYNLDPVRVETELAFRNKLNTDGAELTTNTLFVNAYFDIKNKTPFTPYVGGGIGLSSIDFKIENPNFSKSSNAMNFAWNVGAGLSYELSQKSAIDLGYRFVDYGDARFSRSISPNTRLKVHGKKTGRELLFAFRYGF